LQGNSCDTPPISTEPPHPARLWAWSAHAYYLRYSPRHYAHSSAAIPSLYRQVLGSSNGISSTAEDLVNGVVDMQLLYGIDNEPTEAGDGIIDAYLTASEIDGSAGNDWQRVKSVQVTLTLESEDDGLLSSAQTWTYKNGHRITDHRLRHRYTQTFAIRNRL
jgi:type IV pilus assembly protein PilW